MELSAGISSEVILIVQSIIIFFMAAEGGIRTALQDRAAHSEGPARGRGERRRGCMSDIFNVLLFQNTLRTATPVVLAALGCLMTQHVNITNIGIDGMMLIGAFFAVLGSYFCGSWAAGLALCHRCSA